MYHVDDLTRSRQRPGEFKSTKPKNLFWCEKYLISLSMVTLKSLNLKYSLSYSTNKTGLHAPYISSNKPNFLIS